MVLNKAGIESITKNAAIAVVALLLVGGAVLLTGNFAKIIGSGAFDYGGTNPGGVTISTSCLLDKVGNDFERNNIDTFSQCFNGNRLPNAPGNPSGIGTQKITIKTGDKNLAGTDANIYYWKTGSRYCLYSDMNLGTSGKGNADWYLSYVQVCYEARITTSASTAVGTCGSTKVTINQWINAANPTVCWSY